MGFTEIAIDCEQPRRTIMQASEKEEFRSYLEKSGIIDSLTKVLVGLYEEQDKPSSALDFVRQKLGATLEDAAAVESIKKENAELKKENANLKKQIAELTKAQQPQ